MKSMQAVVVSDVCGRSAGAYQTTLLLCRELSRQQVDVTCFATTVEHQWILTSDRFVIEEPLLRRGFRWDLPNRCLANQARRHIEKNDPALVFVVGLTSLCGYLLTSPVANRLLVIELTNATPNKFVSERAARNLSRCRAVLSPAAAIDPHIRETYRYDGPIERMRFWVEDLGTQPEDCPSKFIDFVYLGRLDEEKGLGDLLRATALLVEGSAAVQVTVAGPGPRQTFEELARELRIEDSVRFLPTRTPLEVRATLERSRYLVLPSYHEGYPLVLLDAAQAGVPFLATRVGAISEAFENTDGCELIEPRDPKSLALRMLELLNDTPESYELKRQAIHRRFTELASGATVSRSIGRLLEKYSEP